MSMEGGTCAPRAPLRPLCAHARRAPLCPLCAHPQNRSGNHRIRVAYLNGTVTTLAGNVSGYIDGTGSASRFSSPSHVALDATRTLLYVADSVRVAVVVARPPFPPIHPSPHPTSILFSGQQPHPRRQPGHRSCDDAGWRRGGLLLEWPRERCVVPRPQRHRYRPQLRTHLRGRHGAEWEEEGGAVQRALC